MLAPHAARPLIRDAANGRRRNNRDRAPEGLRQRDDDSGRVFGGLLLQVEVDDLVPTGRELTGQRAAVHAKRFRPDRQAEIDRAQPDLQRVSRLRARDEDGTRQRVVAPRVVVDALERVVAAPRESCPSARRGARSSQACLSPSSILTTIAGTES